MQRHFGPDQPLAEGLVLFIQRCRRLALALDVVLLPQPALDLVVFAHELLAAEGVVNLLRRLLNLLGLLDLVQPLLERVTLGLELGDLRTVRCRLALDRLLASEELLLKVRDLVLEARDPRVVDAGELLLRRYRVELLTLLEERVQDALLLSDELGSPVPLGPGTQRRQLLIQPVDALLQAHQGLELPQLLLVGLLRRVRSLAVLHEDAAHVALLDAGVVLVDDPGGLSHDRLLAVDAAQDQGMDEPVDVAVFEANGVAKQVSLSCCCDSRLSLDHGRVLVSLSSCLGPLVGEDIHRGRVERRQGLLDIRVVILPELLPHDFFEVSEGLGPALDYEDRQIS